MLQAGSTYTDIDVGQIVPSDSAYRFQVGTDVPCGSEIVLTVADISSTDPDRNHADEVAVIRIPIGSEVPLFEDGFEPDGTWVVTNTAGDGEWETGAPEGRGGDGSSLPDPISAYDGDGYVLGNDLTGLGDTPGEYENNVVSFVLSPLIDVSTLPASESVRPVAQRVLGRSSDRESLDT